MSWGTLTLGKIALKESNVLNDVTNANSGVRTITLNGTETSPPLTLAQIRAVQEDMLTLLDKTVPVTFSNKTDRNGFYKIDDINCDVVHWAGEASGFNWSVILSRIGPDNAVDVESRLSHVLRVNDFSLTGERWHAPAIGHYGYNAGSTLPSILARTADVGVITVYRGLPAGVNPRWGVATNAFNNGRVRLYKDAIERSGVGINIGPTGWELNNGLVRVMPGGDTFLIGAWTSGTWRDKDWGLFVTNVVNGTFDQTTVLRNDNECVTIRLLKNISPGPGRFLVDLTLRRGSRFVEGYMQRTSSGDLQMRLNASETALAGTGYVTVSANDSFGNRLVVGSSRTFTSNVGNPNIVRAASTTMDFFIGVALGGGAAAVGDQAANLRDQYAMFNSEMTAVMPR